MKQYARWWVDEKFQLSRDWWDFIYSSFSLFLIRTNDNTFPCHSFSRINFIFTSYSFLPARTLEPLLFHFITRFSFFLQSFSLFRLCIILFLREFFLPPSMKLFTVSQLRVEKLLRITRPSPTTNSIEVLRSPARSEILLPTSAGEKHSTTNRTEPFRRTRKKGSATFPSELALPCRMFYVARSNSVTRMLLLLFRSREKSAGCLRCYVGGWNFLSFLP